MRKIETTISLLISGEREFSVVKDIMPITHPLHHATPKIRGRTNATQEKQQILRVTQTETNLSNPREIKKKTVRKVTI